MENKDIPNSAVTASSSWRRSRHEPWQARLNNVGNSQSTGSWSAASNQVGEWLQIDLGEERVVTKLATQGRPFEYNQWVKSYKVLFSSDETSWREYKENGFVKVIVVEVYKRLYAQDRKGIHKLFWNNPVRFKIISMVFLWLTSVSKNATLSNSLLVTILNVNVKIIENRLKLSTCWSEFPTESFTISPSLLWLAEQKHCVSCI